MTREHDNDPRGWTFQGVRLLANGAVGLLFSELRLSGAGTKRDPHGTVNVMHVVYLDSFESNLQLPRDVLKAIMPEFERAARDHIAKAVMTP